MIIISQQSKKLVRDPVFVELIPKRPMYEIVAKLAGSDRVKLAEYRNEFQAREAMKEITEHYTESEYTITLEEDYTDFFNSVKTIAQIIEEERERGEECQE